MKTWNKMWVISWTKENGVKKYLRISGNSYEDVLTEFLENAGEYEFKGLPEDVSIEYDGYEGVASSVSA